MTTNFISVTAAEIVNAVNNYEYCRLLGLPRERELDGDLLDRAAGAREWYKKHGHPFAAFRRVEVSEITPPSVLVETGHELQSNVLAQRLRAGEAHALYVLATSAGPEVSSETSHLWKDGRPDEAYFLDRLAVAITEQLVFFTAGELCRAAEPVNETMLPHLSPGCGNWDISDQHQIWSIMTGAGELELPIRLESSGALYPQHSYLAVSGITHRKYSATPRDLCKMCDLKPCAFRRAPFAGETLQTLEIQ